MLSRSKSSPLTLCFTDLGRTRRLTMFDDIIPTTLTSQAHRLRTLDLGYISRSAIQSVVSCCENGLPMLQDLSFASRFSQFPEVIDTSRFRNGLPPLKTLELRYIGIPWDHLPLSNGLRELRLAGPSANPCRPSSGAFVNSFKELLRLEALHLDGYLPLDGNQLSSSPLVTMHKLKHLILEDSAETITFFLRTVCISNCRTVEIIITNPNPDNEVQFSRNIIADLKGSWSSVKQRLSPIQHLISPKFLKISEGQVEHSTTFTLLVTDPEPESCWWAQLTLSIPTTSSLRHSPRLVTAITEELDFAALGDLIFDEMGLCSWDEALYRAFFKRLNQVSIIRLSANSCHFTKPVLDIMAARLPDASPSDSPLLPALSTIEIWNTDMESFSNCGIYRSLRVLLESRPISKLGVSGAVNFGRMQVEDLERNFPVEVVWDGRAVYKSYELDDGLVTEDESEDDFECEDDEDENF